MKNKSKTMAALVLSAVLCFAPVTYVKADNTKYVYSEQKQEEQMDGYVYQQGETSPPEEEKNVEKDEDGESLQDLAMKLLDDNKINIVVLMILLAALGIVLYRNDKLTASRKR